jgi:hypothetical protein
MSSRATRAYRHASIAAAVAIAFSIASPVQAQRAGEGPLGGLAGSWAGSGVITLSSGASERIRCRATYAIGANGNAAQQVLRCASDSYNFNLVSNVTYEGGAISGSWREATRNASGSISGRARHGLIQAVADGPGFSANLTLVTHGNQQGVTIRSAGTELVGVSVALNRY